MTAKGRTDESPIVCLASDSRHRRRLPSRNQELGVVINKSQNQAPKTVNRLRARQHPTARLDAADQGAQASRMQPDLFRHRIRKSMAGRPELARALDDL